MKRLWISTLIVAVMTLASGCAVFDLFNPGKVEQYLAEIQIKYGGLLDRAIEKRRQGLIPDALAGDLTELFDRFETGYQKAADRHAEAEAEAANLDDYIQLRLTTAGLDDLHHDYLLARQQAQDQAPDVADRELDLLRTANAARRAAWDALIE